MHLRPTINLLFLHHTQPWNYLTYLHNTEMPINMPQIRDLPDELLVRTASHIRRSSPMPQSLLDLALVSKRTPRVVRAVLYPSFTDHIYLFNDGRHKLEG